MMQKKDIFLIVLILMTLGMLACVPVTAAPTTQLQVVKYANDGTTVLNQTTVNFTWMEANLPVYGDGTTHYYHQGPNFTQAWNVNENDPSILTKDMGAVKGSDLKDICDLAGGMSSGDYNVTLLAGDGFSQRFNYASIYTPTSRAGPIIITWYRDGGYVNGTYADGLRNVMFADSSVNPWGYHVFGLYDMNQSFAPEFMYFYNGNPNTPSTTGLSVKTINRVYIYSNEDAPASVAPTALFQASPVSGVVPLQVQFTDQSTGTAPLTYAWDFNNDLVIDNTTRNPLYTYAAAGTYTVNLTVSNAIGSDSEVKTGYIAVSPTVHTIYDGDVTLIPGEKFNVTSYLAPYTNYTVNRTTPLGALYKVAALQGLTVNMSDKRWSSDEVLLLDDISQYIYKKPNVWYAYVNGVYKDGYANHPGGLNVIELAENDQVNFYYAPNKDPNPVLNATDVIKIRAKLSSVHTIYDGEVSLTTGEKFNVTSYLAPYTNYTVNRTTPLGALYKVAALQGLTVNMSDKRWSSDEVLLLDDISQYIYKKPNVWYAYVNGVYKDGYANHPGGLNVIELAHNDQVNFYYAPNKDPNPVLNATDVIRIKANLTSVHTIYDGEVSLTPGETFNVTSYLAPYTNYTVNRTTPLGALYKVAALQGLTVNMSDKRWSSDEVLLLDDISQYIYKKPNVWYAYVNGVYKDGYANHPGGLNVIELAHNDQVNFYYAPNKDPNPVLNATDVIKIRVNTTAQPSASDWTLALSGAKNTTVSQTLFEQGLACPSSGHQVSWTDTDGNTWSGVPLWLLVAMVDDNPDVGTDHYNFNDTLAARGYSVKVVSGDGWDTTLSSADIARNDSYIVANTLNGQALPRNLTNGKLSWPLHLKGAAVFGGQQVGNITRIELSGLPEPSAGWELTLEGDVTDVITQSFFEEAIACHHNVTWTDGSGNVWKGVALWDLVGAVDDIESSSHFTFNSTRAAANYTVRVSAADGFNATFNSSLVASNNGYIVAYQMNGAPLTGSSAPLKLVGPSTTSGKERVGNISFIRLEGLPDQLPAGDWQLFLDGKISDTITQPEFESWAAHHSATYTDANGLVYTGIPLWRLMGWVDDRVPHGPNGFNDAEAIAGYKVIVKAGDGYSKEFTSQQIGKDDHYIIANTLNGSALPTTGSHPPYPLRLVGSDVAGGNSVGNLVEIQLTDFQTVVEAPKLHIIKYAADATTVINETTIDYVYMESNLPVIGDGTTIYKYEGLTLNPANLWDPEETYPGGYKVSNAVKGSRVRDLAELVGGMGSGTAVTFIASDGFESTLPYSSIYTNPAVQSRQGDAIIAWWGDGQYVPDYADGMRLFFMPEGDHVYGHWDMHETLPSEYWRYNFQNGVQYPSAAGLSAKYITTMKVYSVPESTWTLKLDGRDIGGLEYTVSKPFLEEALACQMGANHKATYTDSKGRVWEGMPLWFFAGFVDDADQHSANAFNATRASAGYSIIINSSDGSSTTIDSRLIKYSSNYIVANSLNGSHIPDNDENWPLRLTGANVTGSSAVRNISSIKLVRMNLPQAPVAGFSATPVSGTAPLTVRFTDASTNTPTSWNWSFGDNSTVNATARNPVHTFVTAGTYNITLQASNDLGTNASTRTGYITVKKPALPVVSAVSPSSWYRNRSVAFSITGSNFQPGYTTVGFSNQAGGYLMPNLTLVTATKIEGTVWVPVSEATGAWNVNVTTLTSGDSQRQNAFTLGTTPLPTITSITPSTGARNYTVNFTLTGTGFQTGAGQTRVRIFEDFMDTELAATIISISPTTIAGSIDITNNAIPGSYLLGVTTVDGGTATKENAFSVGYSGIPTITAITPNAGFRNDTVQYTITGTNFQPGLTTVTFRNQTTNSILGISEVSGSTSTRIIGNLTIPASVPLGLYRLDIKTTDGGVANKRDAFRVETVKAPVITSITPTSGAKGSIVAFTLTGSNFMAGEKTSVTMLDDTTGTELRTSLLTVTPTKILGSFTIPATAPSGKYRLKVSTTDGGTVNKYEAFTVNYLGLPVITSLNPTTGSRNTNVTFTLKGDNFVEGGTIVRMRMPGTTINATALSVNTTIITGEFPISTTAGIGSYRLDVITGAGGFNNKQNAFTVRL